MSDTSSGGMNDVVLKIRSLFENTGVKQAESQMKKLLTTQQKFNVTAVTAAKNLGLQFDGMSRGVKLLERESRRFKGEYLSIMFLGMGLTRVFGGFYKTAYATFQKAVEGTDKANNSLQRLNAGWEFLKFSLIDALMSSGIFQWIVEGLIKAIDWFNNLGTDAKNAVNAIILTLIGLGTYLTLRGSITLGMTGLGEVYAANSALGIMKGLLSDVTKIATIYIAIKGASDALEEFRSGKYFAAFIDAIETGLAAYAAYGLIAGKGVNGYLFVMLVGLELTKSEDFVHSFIGLFTKIIAALVTFTKFIANAMAEGLRMAITNGVIDVLNDLAATLRRAGLSSAASMVQGLANGLENFKSKSNSFDWAKTYNDVLGQIAPAGDSLASLIYETRTQKDSSSKYTTNYVTNNIDMRQSSAGTDLMSRMGYGSYLPENNLLNLQ